MPGGQNDTIKVAVIIAAAGLSSRFGSTDRDPAATHGLQKLEMRLGDRPVLMRSVDLFVTRADVGQVIVATNPDTIDLFKSLWGAQLSFLGVTVVPGGRLDRWQTVQAALEHIDAGCTHVAIHDGARPLAGTRLIDRVFQAAQQHPAVIPAVPVSSSLKRVQAEPSSGSGTARDKIDDIPGPPGLPGSPGLSGVSSQITGTVIDTVSRADVYLAQTPQIFAADLLRRAYDGLKSGKIDPAIATDDASVVQAIGEPVAVVLGEATNIKITYPSDLALAAAIVASREKAETVATAKKRLFVDEED